MLYYNYKDPLEQFTVDKIPRIGCPYIALYGLEFILLPIMVLILFLSIKEIGNRKNIISSKLIKMTLKYTFSIIKDSLKVKKYNYIF